MSTRRILAIVDNDDLRRHFRETLLPPAGYRVIAGRRRDTISAVPPDVIILGDVEGHESTRIVQIMLTRFPASPLIVLLAKPGPAELAADFYHMGVFECLLPPYPDDQVLKAVERGMMKKAHLEDWAASLNKRNIESLEKQVDELESLARVGRSVTSVLDLDQVLAVVVQAAVEMTDAEEGSLLLLDENGRDLVMRASFNFQDEIARTFRLPTSDSLAGQVLHTGEPLLLEQDTPEKIQTHYLVRSLIYVPLVLQGKPIGVLGVDNKGEKRSRFQEFHIPMMTALADFAAIAIENARLYLQTEHEREKLAALVKEVADGILVVDDAQRVILANQSARSILGIDVENVIDRPLAELTDRGDVLAALQDHREGTLPRIDLVMNSGRAYTAQVTSLNGIGRAITIQDVTHFKELDKMKNDFVNSISHDLRSPLTAIMGYIDLIARVGETNERQKEFIRRVQTNVENMTDMIEALLELGRIGAGFDLQKEPVDFTQVIGNALQGIQHQIETKSQTVLTDLPMVLPPVSGNPLRLRQMVANLLENANKYTPRGGQIDVRVRLDSGQIMLEVVDSGVGIPAAEQPFVFEKLFRASNIAEETTGTGLGLAIVKSIVESHGGRLWFESTMGKGSTFTVVLPAMSS